MNHVVLLKSRPGHQGGLEKYATRIANAFLNRGARVTILTTGKAFSTPILPVYATQTVPWPAFLRMDQFDRFVQKWVGKEKPDLIFGMDRNRYQTHIRAGNGVHAAYLASRSPFKKMLCKINPLHQKILELEKTAFEYPGLQKLFTNSQMVRRQVLQYYKTDPHKIQVVHNGVEWDEMASDFRQWEEKRLLGFQKFHLDPNRFHFLFIGHGYARKGLDPLLAALAQLKTKEFHLSVIGKDRQMEFYRAKAVQLGLQNRVHFFGPSQETRLFYQLADALVVPSLYDPFANVTVEALAMGLYVVSSKQNGGHEILTPANGTVIEDLGQSETLVKALETALAHPKTAQSALKARQSVEHLDFSHQLDTLIKACGIDGYR